MEGRYPAPRRIHLPPILDYLAVGLLAAMIISMLFAAVMVRANGVIVRRLAPRALLRDSAGASRALRHETEGRSSHVIIAGFGRMGQNVAALLRILNVEYEALDLNAEVVHEARDAGEPVYFGNAAQCRPTPPNAGCWAPPVFSGPGPWSSASTTPRRWNGRWPPPATSTPTSIPWCGRGATAIART
ncbi:MAG: NAD-binding protein [Gammaproteobacteria bacterium]|nr:NAD-binding protein [Gammaproteobacteria bacterium]